MKPVLALLVSLALAGAAAAKTPCEKKTFEGASFTVCEYDPQTDEIDMAWRASDGAALTNFAALRAALKDAARRVHFAVNAGMFHEMGRPVGLFVRAGVQERPLNRNKGPGNFHMLPNGVFWVGRDGRAHVETSETFAKRAAKPALATQSGPMLLIGGRLHPGIQSDGPSRLIRNGVGETKSGGALFVVSEDAVSFGKMARFFRDGLSVQSALYLDGSVSSLWEPGTGRMDLRAPLGPMIWVY